MQYIMTALIVGILIGICLKAKVHAEEEKVLKISHNKQIQSKNHEIERLLDELEYYKRQENCDR